MQQQFPEDMPDMEPSPAMKALDRVLAEKKFDYAIRCPWCQSFYPNPVPKTAPGDSVMLKCKPSKQWRGRQPPVPKGERAEWCGKMFRIRVKSDVEVAHEKAVKEAQEKGKL